MRRKLTGTRVALVAGLLAALVVVAGAILYAIPSNDYILLPDRAHPVAPLVSVPNPHGDRGPGGIYFVDVLERRASELEKLFPWIHGGKATLLPASEIVPPGLNDKTVRKLDLQAMSISQRVAAAVALRKLGYKVVAAPAGVIVQAVASDSHAAGKLQPGDVIVSVNGTNTPTVASLHTVLGKLSPGDVAALGLRRESGVETVRVKTVQNPLDHKRALVGFTPGQSADIRLPLKVTIDAGNVGGPSAGLAFALEVMEQLGRDVDHGYRVAATGEINLDGAVTPIGGVKQKTFGVRDADADVFLVPAGENAREAKRYAHGLRVIPVKSFQQALHALATLPPKD